MKESGFDLVANLKKQHEETMRSRNPAAHNRHSGITSTRQLTIRRIRRNWNRSLRDMTETWNEHLENPNFKIIVIERR